MYIPFTMGATYENKTNGDSAHVISVSVMGSVITAVNVKYYKNEVKHEYTVEKFLDEFQQV